MSDRSRHTPGPWRAVDAGDGYEIVSNSPEMSATVATITARRSVTGAADARLIAAAPDLLASLIACKHGAEYPDELGEIIDAAIAKVAP